MNDWRYSAQAENSIAGCLLVDPEATTKQIRGKIAPSDFQSESARTIFTVATKLIADGKPCDPVIIQNEAQKMGLTLSDEYCREAMLLFATTANVAVTAEIVHESAIRRSVHEIGDAILMDQLSPVEALAKLQQLLTAQNSSIHSPMEAANTVMDYILSAASGKSNPFVKTGYQSLDAQLSGGLVSSGLITVAARPGTGKTTVALNIADNVAAAGGVVLYVSLEMTEVQLWACRAASLSGLSRSRIYAGEIHDSDQEWERLSAAMDTLSRRKFYIRDIPSTVEDVEREARCIEGLSLIVIDHIGLIRPSAGQKTANRYEFVTDITHRLMQLALSMRIPILALCQLNRSSEARENKRPTMADLRDSGAIEEDSDVVCLLFREAQYAAEENRPKPWEAQDIDLIVDKNRHGMTGTVTLTYFGMNARIIDRGI